MIKTKGLKNKEASRCRTGWNSK